MKKNTRHVYDTKVKEYGSIHVIENKTSCDGNLYKKDWSTLTRPCERVFFGIGR